MIKHDYKQQVNKEQEQEETVLETILAGVTFLALLGLVSTCIYIVGAMQ